MSRVLAFARFWYAFIFGDDWLIAAGVAAAIGITHHAATPPSASSAVTPIAVIALLVGSVRRGSRRAPRNESEVP